MSRISVLLLVLIIPLQLFSIENKFEYITSDQGLSQGNIEYIFQDSKGFIWFATFNGLNRYNGYDMTVFNHDPENPNSISHEHIAQICEDNNGDLWLATYGAGVTIFNTTHNNFERIESVIIGKDTLALRQISSIACSPDGNVWFADEALGFFVFNGDHELVKAYRHDPNDPNSLPEAYYLGIVFDSEGTAWLGIGNGTLGKIRAKSDKVELMTFEQRTAAADDGIKSMFVDHSGRIWIGTTSQGAYLFNPQINSFINYRKESSTYHITANTVMAFAETPDGKMLIGTDGGGINIIDRETDQLSTITYNLGNPETINTNAIYALLIDNASNLWVGTYSGGVNFQSHYKNKFKKYTPNPLDNNSLSYKNVTAILQDDEGEVWIGTDGGGLNRFDMATDSFTHYRADPTNPNWLQTDVIIHLMQDKDGDIYISSYNHGLTLFNKDKLSWKQYLPDDSDPTSIAGINPWFCFEDSYGIIWVGMLAVGLDQFDKETETFKHYIYDVDDPTTLYSPNIKVIYEDMNMDLWVGTEGGGLHKYNRDEDNFTRYYADQEDTSSLSNNDVRALYEDLNMRFWVGTNNGLCLMDRDSGTFKVLTTEDGLPGNTINGILEDNQGFLWISTDNGLSRFNPDSLTFKNYDKTDGLQGNEFNYTASMITNNGYFFFGGKNGFNMFFPDEIEDNPNPPRIVITRISILNQPYEELAVKERRKKVTKSVSAITELKFNHRQNVLSFEFAALDYGNSGKNQYKYKLEGFDKEWTETNAGKRFATYTNLPGGDYVFRVIASNGDGVWNNEGLSIDITITPPFWKRKWFIGLILILIIWQVIRYIRRRESKLKEEKELLEKKIKEGLEEVNKQKEEVAQKDLELQQKLESEKEQNWYSTGMGRMSSVMSQHKDDLYRLSQSIISELVEYVEVSQGVIYLINDEKDNDPFLELMAAYAPDDKRLQGTRIELGEGQVGTCYKEGTVIKIDNLPEDYAKFSSGLGEESLKHLVVIPLKLNEIVIGVVELLSFKPLADYRINFVEKSGETLTSILTALKANEKTKKLLEQQKMQAEELSAQEEELRQNLEEMQATQEELARMKEAERIAEEERRANEKELMEKLQKQNEELNYEKSLIDAFLENSPDHIYFKDTESKFLKTSLSLAKLFKMKSVEDLLGKSDFDFFDEEHAKPAFEDEQKIMKSGKPMLNIIEKEVHKDGSVSYVKTSKLPLYDKQGKLIGTFGISSDITDMKNLEMEIKIQNEELQAQEEELRQNLEEMQATQDELIRMRELSEEKQMALEKEEYLFKALLDSANEAIYFKDHESRFIRVSKSMMKQFKVKDFSEMEGKSDFDFFDEAHARPAFEDEMKIIKTGKPIIDLIEKEVSKDGTVSWVSTSKMPLRDKSGNIVGTFGISKNITADKNLEEELTAANKLLEFEKIMFMALMDNIDARITYKDKEARHLRINKAKSKALGLKDPSEIMGKTDPEVFGSSHTQERLKKEIEQINKGISSFHTEEFFRQKDGQGRWGDTSRIPLKNQNGEIVGGLVITWDITDRKDVQFEHEQLQDILGKLSKDLPVILFKTDSQGIISEVTGKGLELLKLKDQKAAAGKLVELFPDIKKSIASKEAKDSYTFSGKVKIEGSEIRHKCLMVRNKSARDGFSAYILFEQKA